MDGSYMTVTFRGDSGRYSDNTFPVGRTVSRVPGHLLYVEEKVAWGKNMCRFWAVNYDLTI